MTKTQTNQTFDIQQLHETAISYLGKKILDKIQGVTGVCTFVFLIESGALMCKMEPIGEQAPSAKHLDVGTYSIYEDQILKLPNDFIDKLPEGLTIGSRVKDRVTGFEGVVKEFTYSIGGCIYAIVKSLTLRNTATGERISEHILLSNLIILEETTTATPTKSTGCNPYDKRLQL